MTAITVGTATATVPVKAAVAKKSLLARAWNAFVEARMRQAEREIALHRHLLPGQFEIAGDRLAPRSEKELPFAR
jgi:hypothetical protein